MIATPSIAATTAMVTIRWSRNEASASGRGIRRKYNTLKVIFASVDCQHLSPQQAFFRESALDVGFAFLHVKGGAPGVGLLRPRLVKQALCYFGEPNSPDKVAHVLCGDCGGLGRRETTLNGNVGDTGEPPSECSSQKDGVRGKEREKGLVCSLTVLDLR